MLTCSPLFYRHSVGTNTTMFWEVKRVILGCWEGVSAFWGRGSLGVVTGVDRTVVRQTLWLIKDCYVN